MNLTDPMTSDWTANSKINIHWDEKGFNQNLKSLNIHPGQYGVF